MIVVAVFGGGDSGGTVADTAHEMGAAIATHDDWIVLTGGDHPALDGTVKNSALMGPHCQDKPWVGVPRTGVGHHLNGTGLVLDTAMSHKRNYLEAWMCDAAIVLPGGDGTLSEAVSTLCLGKPVLFVGDAWSDPLKSLVDARTEAEWSLPARTAWTDRTLQKFGLEGAPHPTATTDKLILNTIDPENLNGGSQRCFRFSFHSWRESLIATLEKLLIGSDPTHGFPDLGDDRHNTLKGPFDDFVAPPRPNA